MGGPKVKPGQKEINGNTERAKRLKKVTGRKGVLLLLNQHYWLMQHCDRKIASLVNRTRTEQTKHVMRGHAVDLNTEYIKEHI